MSTATKARIIVTWHIQSGSRADRDARHLFRHRRLQSRRPKAKRCARGSKLSGRPVVKLAFWGKLSAGSVATRNLLGATVSGGTLNAAAMTIGNGRRATMSAGAITVSSSVVVQSNGGRTAFHRAPSCRARLRSSSNETVSLVARSRVVTFGRSDARNTSTSLSVSRAETLGGAAVAAGSRPKLTTYSGIAGVLENLRCCHSSFEALSLSTEIVPWPGNATRPKISPTNK